MRELNACGQAASAQDFPRRVQRGIPASIRGSGSLAHISGHFHSLQMKPTIVPLLVGFAFSVGAFSAEPMIERFNRPAMFREKWGEAFFYALGFTTLTGSVSLVVWSFIHVTWYIAMGLLVTGGIAATLACRWLPIPFMTALGPILAAMNILVLHYWAWR
jgi:hypothetical protein